MYDLTNIDLGQLEDEDDWEEATRDQAMMNNLINNVKGIIDEEYEMMSQQSTDVDQMAIIAHEN